MEDEQPEINQERRTLLKATGYAVVGWIGGFATERTGNALYAEEPTPMPKLEPKPDPMLDREKEILERAATIFPDSTIIPVGYNSSFLDMIYAAHITAGRDKEFPLEFTIAQIDKECRSSKSDWKKWDQFAVSKQLALGMTQFMRGTADTLGAKTYTRQDSKKLWNLEQEINRVNKALRASYSPELENVRDNLVNRFRRILEQELKGQKDLAAFDWRLAPDKAFALNVQENRKNQRIFTEKLGGEPYLNAQRAIIAYNVGLEEALKYGGFPLVEETLDYYKQIMNNAGLLVGPKGELYAQRIVKQDSTKA